jgi:hypothetical protein
MKTIKCAKSLDLICRLCAARQVVHASDFESGVRDFRREAGAWNMVDWGKSN